MILMKFTPNSATFLFSAGVLPNAELKDINIKDSSNGGILFIYLDTLNVSNINYERTTIQNVNLPLPLISAMSGHYFNVNNLTAKDVIGPVLNAQNIMSENFTDCTFNNLSSSQDIDANYQNILYIVKTDDPATIGLNANNPDNIYVNNFHVNVRLCIGEFLY